VIRNIQIGFGLVFCALFLVGCGSKTADSGSPATETGTGETTKVQIDGSSTVFPVCEAVAEEFQIAQGGKVHVTVGISGTGGGFKKFCRGETDISNASRPILKEEMEEAKKNGIEYIELPICFDALTIVVHKDNDWVDSISVDDLKKMWEPGAAETITHWNQINAKWPNEKLSLFGAGSDSGTFDYFTEAVNGKAKQSRGDYTASEDDNTLVQGIAGNKYALGYLPFAYYEPNKDKLKALSVSWAKNKSADPVMPNMDNVLAGTYAPLSRPLFIYVNKKAAEKPEVKEFVEFMLTEGGGLAKEVNYLPLPEAAYTKAKERFENGVTGSVFGGVPEVGVTVEDLLAREAVQ
jgi:phosphate transport system substrate-binding protein